MKFRVLTPKGCSRAISGLEGPSAIDFDALNLRVCREPTPLPRGLGRRYAGVSSFGFGGVNAHVVLADGEREPPPAATRRPDYLVLSGRGRAALEALAGDVASSLEKADEDRAARVVAAFNHRRDRLSDLFVAPAGDRARLVASLRGFAAGDKSSVAGYAGAPLAEEPGVAFVFSGNGGQWLGMGRAAHDSDEAFRETFDAIDRVHAPLAGWLLVAALRDPALPLRDSRFVQPMIFAIQSAAARQSSTPAG